MSLLLCDLDDTLLDSAAAFRRWATDFAATHDQDGLLGWLIEREEHVRTYGAQRDLFEVLHQRIPKAASVDDLIEDYYRELIPLLHCEDPVRSSLVATREQGWSVAIVTNGGARQEDKIRAAGLDRLVDTWCVSEIDGYWKPDVRLLAIAAERCCESLSGGWMIGDSADTDIAAANTCGIPSVWLSHGRAWPRDDFRPTFQAASFADAVELVLNNATVG